MQLKHLSPLTIVLLLIAAFAQPIRGGPLDTSCHCNSHSFKCKAANEIDSSDDLSNEESQVCVDCKHFTMGKSCELCIPFYYRDITKPLHHPEVCLPCMCNIYGSIDNGMCDRFNDETRSMTAGQCRCKANVEGRACDQCKLGYYNFMNPSGCEPCDCDAEGSYAPYCNPISGQCPCKPNATGRRCEIPESTNDNSISNQSSVLNTEGGSEASQITSESHSLSPSEVTSDESTNDESTGDTSTQTSAVSQAE